MYQERSTAFGKSPNCPSSERLFAFCRRELGSYARDLVARHINQCDFCSAEFELYKRYPILNEESLSAGEIPEALSQLAEAILTNRTEGTRTLIALLESFQKNDSELS